MTDQTPSPHTQEQVLLSLLQQMTLDEKVSLLSGKNAWETVPIDHLRIPSLVMTDGPHGVRADNAEGRIQSTATAFPTGSALASTWNRCLIEELGTALAEETNALGGDILLGPCVNIVRHPLAGRNFESYSEDPYQAGQIGTAWVKGVQKGGVGVSLKHFAVNNQEIERFRGSSVIDERTLREIYLPQFETVVKETDPWTVMCSYNRINGIYASQNHYLLTGILRDEWGFQGVVISDWGANHTIFESVQGGLDIEMPGPARYFGDLLVGAVLTWQIDESVIDQAVLRILRLLMRSGRLRQVPRPAGSVNTPEHQLLARRLAEEAIVLLQNTDSFLPLQPERMSKLAIIGPNATDFQISGGGSSTVTPPYKIQPLAALQEKLSGKTKISYAQGCDNSPTLATGDERFNEAVALAKAADAIIFFAGYPEFYESEGSDRPNLSLTNRQDELISAIAQVNPNIVVVLNCGSPVAMPWLEAVKSVVLAHYSGMEGGNAIAKVLLGETNPSGKLTVSYPICLEETPAFLYYPGSKEVQYGEGIFVGYRYYEARQVNPMFPFGHGLSYTTFTYQNLKTPATFHPGEAVHVSVSVTNTGQRSGQEVVQLYVHDGEASLGRPPKELKAFTKIHLEPGETREVSFELGERAFAFYAPDRQEWIAEPGQFTIQVGSSSQMIHLTAYLDLVA